MKRLLGLSTIILLSILLASCGSSSPTPATGSGPEPVQDTTVPLVDMPASTATEILPTHTPIPPTVQPILETQFRIDMGADVNQLELFDNKLWIATDEGLIAWDLSTDENYTHTFQDGLPASKVNTLVACDIPEPRLVVGTDLGLGLFDPATETWTQWHSGNSGMSENVVEKLSCSRSNSQLYIKYDYDGAKLGQELFDADSQTWLPIRRGFGSDPISAANDGGYSILGGGLYYFQPMNNFLADDRGIPGKPGSWKTHAVEFMFIDPDSGTMQGKQYDGVVFTIDNDNEPFYKNLGGMINADRPRLEQRMPVFYVNIDTGEITAENPTERPDYYDQALSFMEEKTDAITNNPINFIYEDFMGISGLGFIGENPDGILLRFVEDTDDFPDVGKHQLAIGADGTVWVGASNGLVKGQGDRWLFYDEDNYNVITSRHVEPTLGGKVWVAGHYAICLFDPVLEGCEDTVENNDFVIQDIIADSEGTLYIGGEGIVYALGQGSKEARQPLPTSETTATQAPAAAEATPPGLGPNPEDIMIELRDLGFLCDSQTVGSDESYLWTCYRFDASPKYYIEFSSTSPDQMEKMSASFTQNTEPISEDKFVEFLEFVVLLPFRDQPDLQEQAREWAIESYLATSQEGFFNQISVLNDTRLILTGHDPNTRFLIVEICE